MDAVNLYLTASDISIAEEQTVSDIFLKIRMRLFSTQPNHNREGVTEAFIDEIIANPEKYACLPLYVDVERLRSRNYASQGHMFNRETGRFYSTQIGSFFSFYKVSDEYGVSLFGEARIPKREDDICQCIIELYNMGILNFSFEIKYNKSAVIIKDGIQYVDASPLNAITGMAIVSVPAYTESKAYSLVAEEQKEDEDDADDAVVENEGVEKNMTLEEAMNAIAEKDARIAELESNVAAAEQKAEEAETAKTEKEEELTKAEENKNQLAEEVAALTSASAEKDSTIAELQAKIDELEPMRAELDQIKAERAAAELQEKQDKAKAFAEKQNLDVTNEAVAKTIAELDYEALASLSMENANDNKEQPVTIASYTMTQGFDVSRFGSVLDRR